MCGRFLFARQACLTSKQTIKKISYRWKSFHLRECDLKNYEGIILTKLRPVLVISDNEKLLNRSLVVELSTKKQNENSIHWYSWFSKKTNSQRHSWMLPDRIHTVARKLLTNQNRMFNELKDSEKRNMIINFYIEMFSDNETK